MIHGWEETFWNRDGGARAIEDDSPPTTSD
jgi:hypothetical protein